MHRDHRLAAEDAAVEDHVVLAGAHPRGGDDAARTGVLAPCGQDDGGHRGDGIAGDVDHEPAGGRVVLHLERVGGRRVDRDRGARAHVGVTGVAEHRGGRLGLVRRKGAQVALGRAVDRGDDGRDARGADRDAAAAGLAALGHEVLGAADVERPRDACAERAARRTRVDDAAGRDRDVLVLRVGGRGPGVGAHQVDRAGGDRVVGRARRVAHLGRGEAGGQEERSTEQRGAGPEWVLHGGSLRLPLRKRPPWVPAAATRPYAAGVIRGRGTRR